MPTSEKQIFIRIIYMYFCCINFHICIYFFNNNNFSEFSAIILDNFKISLNHKLANEAAQKIQMFWKMYKIKKESQRLKLKKLLFYNMIHEHKPKLNRFTKFDREKEQSNKKLWFDEQFYKICEDEKSRIVKIKGPWIMEDITDHIREWFREL